MALIDYPERGLGNLEYHNPDVLLSDLSPSVVVASSKTLFFMLVSYGTLCLVWSHVSMRKCITDVFGVSPLSMEPLRSTLQSSDVLDLAVSLILLVL